MDQSQASEVVSSLSAIKSYLGSRNRSDALSHSCSGSEKAVIAIIAVILGLLVLGIIAACLWGAGTYPTYSPLGMMRLKLTQKKEAKQRSSAPLVRAAVHGAAAADNDNDKPLDEVTEAQVQHLLAGSEPVVVMVYASWCGFCKKAAPVLAKLAALRKDIHFVKIENTKAEALSKANNITGFPTFLHNFGERKSVGYKTHEQMTVLLNQARNAAPAHAAHAANQHAQRYASMHGGGIPHHQQHMHQHMHHQQQARAVRGGDMLPQHQRPRIVANPRRIDDNANPSNAVIEVNSEDEVRDLLSGDAPVLVAIVAPWCGYCKKFAPVLDEVAAAMAPLKIVKIQNDKCQSLCEEKGISGFPTMLYNWGQGMDVGYKTSPELMRLVTNSQ